MRAFIRPTVIQGWIPKPRFNSSTQILSVIEQIPVRAQKRSSITTTNNVERPTKQVKVITLPKLDTTTEEYNSYLNTRLKNSDTIPSKLPVRETIVKLLMGLMCPNPPYAKDHDAITLLQGYTHDGCPMDCVEDWLQEHLELMLQRVPHQSDLDKKDRRQLRQETVDKITQKYARVVKWGDIKDNIPPKL